MRSRWTAAALLLLLVAVVLLFVGYEVEFGAPWTDPPRLTHHIPWTLPMWPMELAFLAAVGAGVIGLVFAAARLPLAVAVLGIALAAAVARWLDLISFYDGGGIGAALGVASLAALWVVAAPRDTDRRWWDALSHRLLAYVTALIVLVPTGFAAGAGVGCVHADPEDDLCGLAGVIIGVPLALLAWLVLVVVSEVVTARRRSTDSSR